MTTAVAIPQSALVDDAAYAREFSSPKRDRDADTSDASSPKRGPGVDGASIDLGASAFTAFGLDDVIRKGVTATVKYTSNNEAVDEVVLAIEDVRRLGGKDAEAKLLTVWRKHATHWNGRQTAVFRGQVARQLAVLVDAAHEVSEPSYTALILKQLFVDSAVIENRFRNPHLHAMPKGDTGRAWFAREEALASLYEELDIRLAAHSPEYLARIHNHRRLGRGAIERKGRSWASFRPEFEAAIKADGIEKMMLAYHLYSTQLDPWQHHLSGKKDDLREFVGAVEGALREELKASFPSVLS